MKCTGQSLLLLMVVVHRSTSFNVQCFSVTAQERVRKEIKVEIYSTLVKAWP